jgi:hypothetical protein
VFSFIPGERAPVTHSIGDCVGPRAGVDDVERKKNLYPYRGSNFDPSAIDAIFKLGFELNKI